MLNLVGFLLNLLFPNSCLGCRAPNTLLCDRCLRRLDLAEPLDNENQLALFSYRDELVRRAIQSLKYGNRPGLAEILADQLADFLTEELSDRKIFGGSARFLIIPIPMSRWSKLSRGYNQAALIARALAQKLNFPCQEKVLVKIKKTPRQVSIRVRSERLKNLKGAFGIKNPEKIRGCHIILVDDVITTGATMSEAARVLKSAGAKSVLAVAVAH